MVTTNYTSIRSLSEDEAATIGKKLLKRFPPYKSDKFGRAQGVDRYTASVYYNDGVTAGDKDKDAMAVVLIVDWHSASCVRVRKDGAAAGYLMLPMGRIWLPRGDWNAIRQGVVKFMDSERPDWRKEQRSGEISILPCAVLGKTKVDSEFEFSWPLPFDD